MRNLSLAASTTRHAPVLSLIIQCKVGRGVLASKGSSTILRLFKGSLSSSIEEKLPKIQKMTS